MNHSLVNQRPPRCTLINSAPVDWRVTVAPPDGGAPIALPLMATTRTEAALLGAELVGPGSRVRRVQRQGEW